jgi:hypothetical protein
MYGPILCSVEEVLLRASEGKIRSYLEQAKLVMSSHTGRKPILCNVLYHIRIYFKSYRFEAPWLCTKSIEYEVCAYIIGNRMGRM